MTNEPTKNGNAREPDVRPQKPRPAPSKAVWKKPPDAWDRNPRGVGMIFLLLNLALFIYACLLFSRLTTGDYLPPNELSDFAFSNQPLGEFLRSPIDIWQSPMTAVIITLFLALFVTGVLIISQFYGPGWSCLFIAPLWLLAHMPLLAIAMLGAAGLANSRWLGIRNRFVKGIIALGFPTAALWISTGATESFKSPMEKVYMHFPWVAAIALSLLLTMLFWIVARLARYRTGVATLLIGLLVVTAGGLFLYGVGQDQLEFQLLQRNYGLDAREHFLSRSIKSDLDQWSDQLLSKEKITDPTPSQQAWARSNARLEIRLRAGSEMESSREKVQTACRRFLERFPSSRYRPYVLFLLARAQDMRLDLSCVRREQKICYYEDRPSAEGRNTWISLYTDHRDHPLAILAQVRMAQWSLARAQDQERPEELAKEIDYALRQLREAWEEYRDWQDRYQQKQARPVGGHYLLSIFNLQQSDPVKPHVLQERIEPVPRWIWLIEHNRGPGDAGDLAISKYFAINPHTDPADYEQELRELQAEYPAAPLVDNLDLAIRLQIKDESKRLEALQAFVASRTGAASVDAHHEALAEMAQLLAKGTPRQKDEAREIYRRLLGSPEPFASQARQALHLHALGKPPASEPSPSPTTQP